MVDIIIVSAYNSAGGDPVQQTENVKVALGTIKAFIVGLEKITPQFLLMCDKEVIEVQKILPFLSGT